MDRAQRPELLAACLDASSDDPVDPVEHVNAARIGGLLAEVERERDEALQEARETRRLATRVAAERDKARQAGAARRGPAPRLADEWVRVVRRTGRAIWRRIPLLGRRP
jgi:hypothetical protein